MSIRYENKLTGQVALLANDRSFISFKERYGTRMQIFKGRHRDQAHFYLEHRGFFRVKRWRCICYTCGRVEEGHPCVALQDKNPTGECIAYPKKDYPNLEHHNVRYILE